MSREEALNLINVTQAKLLEQHGIPPETQEDMKGGIPSLFDISVPIPFELLQGNDDGKMSKSDKAGRNRPSRWHDPDPLAGKDGSFPLKPFNYGQDQDMRINSNGDIDMRTLPPPSSLPNLATLANASTAVNSENNDLDLEQYNRGSSLQPSKQDLDIRSTNVLTYPITKDVDIRQQPMLPSKDVDIRRIPSIFDRPLIRTVSENDTEDEPMLQIDTGDDNKEDIPSLPSNLPKTQRDLFMRIQSQQKENVVEKDNKEGFEISDNINWYSDDDDEDDNRLTIKVDTDDVKEKESFPGLMDTSEHLMSPPSIKPLEVVEKLGDLSKIDISAEVTKLLTSMSQNRNQFLVPKETTMVTPVTATPVTATPSVFSDPRTSRQDPRMLQEKSEMSRPDPRLPASDPRLSTSDPRQRSRVSSIETPPKPEKISIYEQGSIDRNASPTEEADIDLRGIRSDVDLRNMQLPFKGMENYTPASEIDASIHSHPPMPWKVHTVEIPRPDYNGLKLSISDAEKTGDPRLRKIFRLSTEERDTPLSPKASPKASAAARVDPRLRKIDEGKSDMLLGMMNFTQQLTMLQSSAFYLSLTSNQKVLLNQELNQRNDSSNSHDPVLNSLLSNLNIIPGSIPTSSPNAGTALSILSNVSKLNPMLGQGQQSNLPANSGIMGQNPNLMNQMAQNPQPGLLGVAPGIPNLPPEYPMNFDPRNVVHLGNAPGPFGGGWDPPQDGQGNFNYGDDFYPPESVSNFQGGNNNRDSRNFNRDRRRRGGNFRNNNGNRNFRNRNNNRSNRTHSPP